MRSNLHKMLINFSLLIFLMLILVLQTQLIWIPVICGIPGFLSEKNEDFSWSVIQMGAILI